MELWFASLMFVLFIGAAIWFFVSRSMKTGVRVVCGSICAVLGVLMGVYLVMGALLLGAEDSDEIPTEPTQPSSTTLPTEEPTQTQPPTQEPEYTMRDMILDRTRHLCEEALRIVEEQPKLREAHTVIPFDTNNPKGLARLKGREIELYWQMQEKIENLEDFTYLTEEIGHEGLNQAFKALAALHEDYPFYASYMLMKEMMDGEDTVGVYSVYFMPDDPDYTPVTDKAKLRDHLELFEEVTDLIVSQIPRDRNTYEQYRYLANYLSLSAHYEMDASMLEVSTPYGAIFTGNAICQGYANAFVYLCQKADLYCTRVDGSSDGEGHAWNLIQLEDGTYHVDITWSDNGINYPSDRKWFQYFAVTQETILKDHNIDDGTVATGMRQIAPPMDE